MFRTFQPAEGTTGAQPCINEIFKQVLANACCTFLIINVRFIFVAKMSDGAQHRMGSSAAEAAERTGHHELTEFYESVEIIFFSVSLADILQDVMHLLQSFTAGNTFPA